MNLPINILISVGVILFVVVVFYFIVIPVALVGSRAIIKAEKERDEILSYASKITYKKGLIGEITYEFDKKALEELEKRKYDERKEKRIKTYNY